MKDVSLALSDILSRCKSILLGAPPIFADAKAFGDFLFNASLLPNNLFINYVTGAASVFLKSVVLVVIFLFLAIYNCVTSNAIFYNCQT